MRNDLIHAIWLGGPINALGAACLDDWSKQGYHYKLWTENDIEIINWIEQCEFARKCYEKKLYAFVTDYLRLKILQSYGGLYLDTDVTIKNNPFSLFNDCEFCVGLEMEEKFGTAVIYSNENVKLLDDIVEFYECDIMGSSLYMGPDIMTQFVSANSSKSIVLELPKNYFYSYTPGMCDLTGIDDVYLVHWFQHSWKNPKGIWFLKSKNKNFLEKFYQWQKYFFKRFF